MWQAGIDDDIEKLKELAIEAEERFPGQSPLVLWVNIADQRLVSDAGWMTCSTAMVGICADEGSDGTPPGWHRCAAPIGIKEPIGTIFSSRRPDGVTTGFTCDDDGDDDLILSRIIRLQGLEPGVNAGNGIDSYDRYIYIHGTNQEHLLGSPASHGCIRMKNTDIIFLCEELRSRTALVWIGR